MPTFVLMQVGQVLLVREDDGLVLSDDLAPEALPAGRQLPQLLQFTHSASKTQASGPGSAPPSKQSAHRSIEMPGRAQHRSLRPSRRGVMGPQEEGLYET